VVTEGGSGNGDGDTSRFYGHCMVLGFKSLYSLMGIIYSFPSRFFAFQFSIVEPLGNPS